jgi:hypothetical protein
MFSRLEYHQTIPNDLYKHLNLTHRPYHTSPQCPEHRMNRTAAKVTSKLLRPLGRHSKRSHGRPEPPQLSIRRPEHPPCMCRRSRGSRVTWRVMASAADIQAPAVHMPYPLLVVVAPSAASSAADEQREQQAGGIDGRSERCARSAAIVTRLPRESATSSAPRECELRRRTSTQNTVNMLDVSGKCERVARGCSVESSVSTRAQCDELTAASLSVGVGCWCQPPRHGLDGAHSLQWWCWASVQQCRRHLRKLISSWVLEDIWCTPLQRWEAMRRTRAA